MLHHPNWVATHGPFGSPLHERNGWIQDYLSDSRHGGLDMMVGWTDLYMPPKVGKRKGCQKNEIVNGRRAPSALNGEASSPVPKPSTIQFLDLPSEIRLRIYALLVQRGCIFAFRAFYKGKHVCAAAKIVPEDSARSHDGICSLMCANRQIKDEVCSVLYGDNTFVFKIGGENHSQMRLQLKEGLQKQVWSNVFNSEATPLWPLTPNSIRYVRFLTILVQPFARASRHGYERVRESVERTTSIVKRASQLKCLDVFLQDPAPPMFSLETDVFVKARTSGGLSAGLPRDLFPQRTERIQFVLEPFSALYNIKNVTFDGSICPAFAEQLKSVMTSVGPTELPLSSLANKGKRVLERKRVGYSKRRRVDAAVLEYWRPTYVWDTSTPPDMPEDTLEDL